MWCTDVQFFHLQFILHVSGWRAKDLILSVPLTIGSVPYQPPVLPTSVEPSAPPLSPPPYSEGQTYPGVGKWLSRQEFWIWQTVVFRWSLLSQSSYNSFIDLSFFLYSSSIVRRMCVWWGVCSWREWFQRHDEWLNLHSNVSVC